MPQNQRKRKIYAGRGQQCAIDFVDFVRGKFPLICVFTKKNNNLVQNPVTMQRLTRFSSLTKQTHIIQSSAFALFAK
jgi:hypothetical protein